MAGQRAALTTVAVVSACLAIAGCVSPQQRVANKEDLLSAAGFSVHPADTPQRRAALRSLPPDEMVRQDRNGTVMYVFADPLDCACLYVGDQQAFGRYRQEVFQRQLVNEQAMTAQMNENSWDWGPWGGPGFY